MTLREEIKHTETHHEARVFYMTDDAYKRRNALRGE